MSERRINNGIYIRIQIQTFQLLISTEKFTPLPGFEPGTSQYQADMLPIELSWLGSVLKTVYVRSSLTYLIVQFV